MSSKRLVVTLMAAVAALAAASALASAAQAAPQLEVTGNAPPSLAPGASGTYSVLVRNVGDAAVADNSLTVTVTLPPELSATAVSGGTLFGSPVYACSIGAGAHVVTCTGPSALGLGIPPNNDACTGTGFAPACPITIDFESNPALKGAVSLQAEACGGGAPACGSTSNGMVIENFGDSFGIAEINDGAGPAQESAAFPGNEAFWAGACRRSDAPALGQAIPAPGVGSRPTTIFAPNGDANPPAAVPAPAVAPHCIDWGASKYLSKNQLWTTAPAWRLPALTGAGTHPDGSLSMAVKRNATGFADGAVDNIVVDLPPGFVGNPNAVPECTAEQFAVKPVQCPPESQVGLLHLHIQGTIGGSTLRDADDDSVYPVWNLEPRRGRVAELGFAYASGERITTVRLAARVRNGSDNGVTAFVGQIPAALPLISQSITLWGIPWAAHNDVWRAPFGLDPIQPNPCRVQPGTVFPHYIPPAGLSPACQVHYDRTWGSIKPFLSQETDCNQDPVTTMRMDQYLKPGSFTDWGEPAHSDPNWATAVSPSPAVDDCGSLAFAPEVSLAPTSPSADGPSGLDVDLAIAQNNDAKDVDGDPLPVPGAGAGPAEVADYVQAATDYFDSGDGRATAHLKDSVVTLPAGVSVNPSTATGLVACSDAVVGVRDGSQSPPLFSTNDPVDGLDGDDCPAGSKIGAVEVDTPLLDAPLSGDVVLGEPTSTDPESGGMFRMFLVVRDRERGLLVKVYGTAVADPSTGQLTATFRNNPELPFSDLRLRFKSGQKGVLALPQRCGDPGWTSTFTPWSSVGSATPVSDDVDTGAFAIGENCANAFSPVLDAGMDIRAARGGGTFSFRFSRQDGEQYLRGLTARLPQGLLASVKDVPLCTNAQADAGTCPVGSKIGVADAKAGSGDPFVLEEKGEVFLTEGYKGGEYGLSVKIRPVAGPFRGAMELSPIIVRQAIHVDRRTAQVTAVSDPFPLIHHGIPLRAREVTVLVDRGGFMVNPSDCSAKQVGADLVSDQGANAGVSNPFYASGCADLPFEPKLTLALTGRSQIKTGKHPGIKAKVTQQGIGEAGIDRAVVRLPKSLALDPSNAQALCEFADGTSANPDERCPKGSIVGRARAISPLLNDPLVGNVYFVKNVRRSSTGNLIRTLPMIVVALRGEIAINLIGESSTTKGGKLVNTFASVPDAPVSQFNLNITGGRRGIIAVTRTRRATINLCAGRHVAEADIDGQNGKQRDTDVRMTTPCTRKAKRAAKRHAVALRARGGR